MMKYTKIGLFLAIAIITLTSCNDDDPVGPPQVPVRDREEVQLESDSTLTQYLQTHSYNYNEFENPTEDFDYKVRFQTLEENPDKTPLSELVETKTYTLNDVEYNMYRLVVREGVGNLASFADSAFVNYEGRQVNENVFDRSTTPVWFNLPGRPTANGLVGGSIFGFANGIDGLRGASEVNANEDGTLNFSNDYGIATIFIPSGLGYFNQPQGSIPPYSSLIFNVYVYDAVEDTDLDGDGIPNSLEDLNNNFSLLDDDTDGNGVPNYADADDDGDGIPTRDEIIINEDGSLEFPDSSGNGIPDYLDPES